MEAYQAHEEYRREWYYQGNHRQAAMRLAQWYVDNKAGYTMQEGPAPEIDHGYRRCILYRNGVRVYVWGYSS